MEEKVILGYSDNYDFEKLKNIILQNNILLDFPLFLESDSKVVEESRKRFNHIYIKELLLEEAPQVNSSSLTYEFGPFKIIADERYGLPDEFDGMVWDIVLINILEILFREEKAYKGYQISEDAIMEVFTSRNRNTKSYFLLHKIRNSLNRIYATSYEIESIAESGTFKYHLIDAIYRKGENLCNPDKPVYTIIVPGTVMPAIDENKYYVSATRLKLNSSISRIMHDRFYLQIMVKFCEGEISIVARENGLVHYVVDYDIFTGSLGFIPISESEKNESYLLHKLHCFTNELIEHNILHSVFIEKKGESNMYKLIFIFTEKFIASIIEGMGSRYKRKGLTEIDTCQIKLYYAKLESEILSETIKNIIKQLN